MHQETGLFSWLIVPLCGDSSWCWLLRMAAFPARFSFRGDEPRFCVPQNLRMRRRRIRGAWEAVCV